MRCAGERVPIDCPPKSSAGGVIASAVPGGGPPPLTAGPAEAAMPNFIGRGAALVRAHVGSRAA